MKKLLIILPFIFMQPAHSFGDELSCDASYIRSGALIKASITCHQISWLDSYAMFVLKQKNEQCSKNWKASAARKSVTDGMGVFDRIVREDGKSSACREIQDWLKRVVANSMQDEHSTEK